MALLSILEAPHPLLKQPARPVTRLDARLERLAADMLETMYQAPGVGLAAPQVGVLERLIVADIANKEAGETPAPMVIVNPVILWHSTESACQEEGCLSLPGQFADVTRPAAVRIGFTDARGVPREVDATGLLARCLQHEVDHLDGILFVDHLSVLRRNMLLRKLAKSRRARA
jgi:peptide deformylase